MTTVKLLVPTAVGAAAAVQVSTATSPVAVAVADTVAAVVGIPAMAAAAVVPTYLRSWTCPVVNRFPGLPHLQVRDGRPLNSNRTSSHPVSCTTGKLYFNNTSPRRPDGTGSKPSAHRADLPVAIRAATVPACRDMCVFRQVIPCASRWVAWVRWARTKATIPAAAAAVVHPLSSRCAARTIYPCFSLPVAAVRVPNSTEPRG